WAISPPPLPYSRSTVTTLIIFVDRALLHLAYRNFSPAAWLILFENKRKDKHDPRAGGKHHECIHIRERRGLRQKRLINSGVCRRLCFMRTEATVGQLGSHAAHRFLQVEISLAHIVDQNLLMILRTPRDERGH